MHTLVATAKTMLSAMVRPAARASMRAAGTARTSLVNSATAAVGRFKQFETVTGIFMVTPQRGQAREAVREAGSEVE